jgi:hypothetical protein
LTRPKKKMGRPTASDAFNTAVLNQLMFASVDKDSLDESRVSTGCNELGQSVTKMHGFLSYVKTCNFVSRTRFPAHEEGLAQRDRAPIRPACLQQSSAHALSGSCMTFQRAVNPVVGGVAIEHLSLDVNACVRLRLNPNL